MSRDRPSFEAIVWRARQEPLPAIDVVNQVANRIRGGTPRNPGDWSLWGAVGLSVAAAVVVLLLAMQEGVLFDDPLAIWLRRLVMVMQ